MASKLGKLRQWGREVIASKEKTVLSNEFKEIEQDVELRRAGIERLYNVCNEYHRYLQKKKEYSSVEEGVTMLPVDALGTVMSSHGEEYGEDSAFGRCLFNLGHAFCKIATLQETYALSFRDTYLTSLTDALKDFDDYASQRRKLDSRRLSYDAAVTRASKAKKEKEIREAEEEVTKAKLRYEETSTDVQARMYAIQENEIQQLRDLTQLLAAQTRFAEQYLDVLRDTQHEWLDESKIQHTETPRRKTTPHVFAFGRSTPSISSTSKTTVNARPSSAGTSPPGDADEGDFGFSVKRRASPAGLSRPSSRGSTTSVGTAHNRKRSRDNISFDAGSTGIRSSVAGWASSAVSSLSGSGRLKKDAKKDRATAKDRDKNVGGAFSSLDDTGNESDGDDFRREDGVGQDGSRSIIDPSAMARGLGQSPPMLIPHPSKPTTTSSNSSFNSASVSNSSIPSTPRRIMSAIVDFSGASGELTFHAGDEIIVLSEPKSGWCMGEAGGRRGLFPINRAEDVPTDRTRVIPPPLPSRMTGIAQRAQADIASEDGASIISGDFHDIDPHGRLYDEPFGDHHLAKSPMMPEHDHEQEPSGDTATEDEDETHGLFEPSVQVSTPSPHAIVVGNAAGNGAVARQPPALPQRKQSMKKPPPPPPPVRRSTISSNGPAPFLGVVSSGGPSISAPSSTANLAGSAVSFPPPPAAPRRAPLRSQSSIPVIPPSESLSPFDN